MEAHSKTYVLLVEEDEDEQLICGVFRSLQSAQAHVPGTRGKWEARAPGRIASGATGTWWEPGGYWIVELPLLG